MALSWTTRIEIVMPPTSNCRSSALPIQKREKRGKPIDGHFRRGQVYLKDYHDYTFKLQNPDGSFSTSFFKGRGASMDLNRRLETSGHIAEWLSFSLPKDQLTDARMVKGINYLASLLML